MARRITCPTSIWATGQQHPRYQRGDRYTGLSREHPAKMFPATAAHAIRTLSQPGDIVVDPMCGVGTTLVEAALLGRRAFGIDCEAQWVAVAAANLHLARQSAPEVDATVARGDATQLVEILPPDLVGAVNLIVTSPPYGSMTHGLLDRGHHTGGQVVKTLHRYTNHRHHGPQLAHRGLSELSAGLTDIFTACRAVLETQGRLAVAARPWTKNGNLVDFPTIVTHAAVQAGFTTARRYAALLGSWDGNGVTAHHSFFRLHNVRRARSAGHPAHLIVHEDILVFGGDR